MPAVDATAEGLESVLKEVRELGLESHAAELDTCGLTVLPPERVAPRAFTVRLRDAVLDRPIPLHESADLFELPQPSVSSVKIILR